MKEFKVSYETKEVKTNIFEANSVAELHKVFNREYPNGQILEYAELDKDHLYYQLSTQFGFPIKKDLKIYFVYNENYQIIPATIINVEQYANLSLELKLENTEDNLFVDDSEGVLFESLEQAQSQVIRNIINYLPSEVFLPLPELITKLQQGLE